MAIEPVITLVLTILPNLQDPFISFRMLRIYQIWDHPWRLKQSCCKEHTPLGHRDVSLHLYLYPEGSHQASSSSPSLTPTHPSLPQPLKQTSLTTTPASFLFILTTPQTHRPRQPPPSYLYLSQPDTLTYAHNNPHFWHPTPHPHNRWYCRVCSLKQRSYRHTKQIHPICTWASLCQPPHQLPCGLII